MKDASIVLLALVGLLVTAPIVGVVTGQESTSAANSSKFTLDELKQDGPRLENTMDGTRMGQEQMYWAVYWPTSDPFADVGSKEGGEYLPPGTTVRRNSVFLRTWTHETRQETVHVVFWERAERDVKRGNVTTTEPYAANVTHVTHDVTFERGRPTVEIPLGQHDEPVRMTIWIEGKDWARWSNLQHHSSATTQSVDINSAGDYLASVIVDFLLIILVGGFAVGMATKKALDRAGIGPQYGYGPWIMGLTVLTGLAGLLAYQSIADLLVNAKYLLSVYVVGVLGIVMLETYTTNVSKALFLRPTLEHATSPTGDDAFDVIDAEGRTERIVRNPDGTVSVVTPGLFPFLARVFGKSARLENVEELRTRVPMEGSKWDEMFLVDPEAEDLIHYAQEGWELDFPPLDREHALQYLAVVGGVGVGALAVYQGAVSPWVFGGITAAFLGLWGASPVDGLAGVHPAPVHLRPAFGTMVSYAEDVDDAKHIRDVKKQRDSERIRKQREVDEEVAEHDRTLVEEMLDPDAKVPSGNADVGDDGDVMDKQSDTSSAAVGNGEVADDD